MNVKGSSLTTPLLAFVIPPPSQAADIMCEQPTLVEYWVQTVTHLISHSSLLGDTTCSPPYSLSLSLSSHTLIALLSSIYFSPCYCSPFIIITGIHFSLHLSQNLHLPFSLHFAATPPLTAAAALLCLIPEKAICTPATILTPISSAHAEAKVTFGPELCKEMGQSWLLGKCNLSSHLFYTSSHPSLLDF